MPLSHDELKEIVKLSADSETPLSAPTLRELADLAEVAQDIVIREHKRLRDEGGEGPIGPSVVVTPWDPDWRR